jgi:hypothetical protein
VAKAGDCFELPDGSRYIVRQPTADSDGAVVEMEFVLPHGCVPPPPHVHPQQVERYEVLEGRFEVVLDGRWRELHPGDSASERTSHTLRAAGIRRKRDPRVLVYLSMVMLEYGDTLFPGRRRERLPMRALAQIGRLAPAVPRG